MSPHLALRGTAKLRIGQGRWEVNTLGGQEASLISMGRKRPLGHTPAPTRGSPPGSHAHLQPAGHMPSTARQNPAQSLKPLLSRSWFP